MWRTAASMGIALAALAWPALAIILVFMVVPALWEVLFGPANAAYAAIGALGLVVWGSVKMAGLADRLSGMGEGRRATAPAVVEPEPHANWPEYNAAIARNKRWAFYRRTRQFERLKELHEQTEHARSARCASQGR